MVKVNQIAKPGFKFILTFTLPSGLKFAAGEHEGNLALVPIEEDGVLRGVLAWNSSDDVRAWLKFFKDKNDKEVWKKFKKLKPSMGQVKVAQ